MRKLRIGLVGCGAMGQSLARGCLGLEDIAELVAVCDTKYDAAASLGADIGARAYDSCSAMVGRGAIDVGLVACPPHHHLKAVTELAEAGCHVFCEKPLAPTVEACDAMLAACRHQSVKLMAGHVCRYHVVHSKVKELVDSGTFGRPLCMHVQRLGGGFHGVWRQKWRRQRKLSGGNLMEINTHEIDFMRWVCGEVVEVVARGVRQPTSDFDFPDVVIASLTFASGALGCLHASSASHKSAYGGRIDCEKGSLVFPEIWGKDAGIYTQQGRAGSFIGAAQFAAPDPVSQELRDFVEAVSADREPPITGEDGRAAVAIATAAYQSVEEKRPVAIAEV